MQKKWGILIKKESESLVFGGLEIQRDYSLVREVSAMDGDSEYYKEQIIEMVKGIESQKILRLIYGFVRRGYREENAGK